MERSNYWTRKLARRRMLAGTASGGLGAAAFALVGCGDDDDGAGKTTATATTASGGVKPGTATAPTPTTAGEVVKPGGTLNVRQGAPFANISPYNGLDSGLTFGLVIPVYDHLWYTPLDTGVRENFLAATIEQPDPLQFTVTLKDAVFQNKAPINGRALTAEDVAASFTAASKATKISNSSWWTQVLDKVVAIDAKTVKFTLKAVDAWTFSSTNGGSPLGGSILPKEHAADPTLMEKDLIGSGFYEFVSHQNGTNFRLKRNETYREKGKPALAVVQAKLIQEQAAALAAFSAKEIDGIVPNNKLEKDSLVQKHGKDIVIDSDLSRGVWIVQARGDGQFANPLVNQAISLGLDRKEMITLMGNGDGQATGPVPPTFATYALTDKEIADTYGKQDNAEAKKMLAAAAFDLSKEYQLKFIVPGDTFAQFSQIVQAQLKKNLGINVKLVGEDFARWLGQSLYGSDYDGFIVYPSLEYDDPSSYIGAYTLTIGGRPNWAGFKNQELNDLVAKQKATLDDKARQDLIRDLQKKAWTAGAPFIPTFVRVTYAANWGYVKGRTVGRGSYGYLTGTTYIDKG